MTVEEKGRKRLGYAADSGFLVVLLCQCRGITESYDPTDTAFYYLVKMEYRVKSIGKRDIEIIYYFLSSLC
jgi:hypothetical protein